VAVGLALLGSSTAFACDEAERLRLADEISSLAKKNAWSGVERKYNALLKTKCKLELEQYSLGAESAKNLGKTFEMFERLTSAQEIAPDEELAKTIEQLETNFGRVEIRGDARRRAPLIRDSMPFAPDQRKSIEYAQSVMEGTGSFKGMLPVGGPYKVADKEFTVEAGGDWQEIVVGKGKGPKQQNQFEDQGLINWVGPIASVGFGFFGSGAPGDAILREDASNAELIGQPFAGDPVGDPANACGGDQDRWAQNSEGEHVCKPTIRQPSDIGFFQTPALDITVGGEVGLTYRAPEMGVAATVNYRRTFGSRLNQISVWGAAVVRPGEFRFALGPTWGVIAGRGNGYAEWVDEGQSEAFRAQRQDDAQFTGYSMGGGFAGSAGYGVLDLAGFRGMVELHGQHQRDNHRGYTTIGIRFGIIPKIDRFEG
jgi:hypothetical protein